MNSLGSAGSTRRNKSGNVRLSHRGAANALSPSNTGIQPIMSPQTFSGAIRASQLDIQKRLIEQPDRAKVVEAVYRAALDDEHKH